ncbi:hypothetical protein GCM10010415_37860 [Streptomyces atrovirens]|uniref:GNAT family N-acetyltransferase n=1 Tax=Streptomyces atrovirens TaxID=285556 RepID=A0ABW0DNR3_9ACTN
MSATKRTSAAAPVSVRPLAEPDLDRADEIFRVAFGTFLGIPEPETFFGTADYVRTRWAADPHAAFAATVEGEVVGSNFAADWGSVGFFGPLTVRPDLWDQGIGRRLMEPVMDRFGTWGNRHLGLVTGFLRGCPGLRAGEESDPCGAGQEEPNRRQGDSASVTAAARSTSNR